VIAIACTVCITQHSFRNAVHFTWQQSVWRFSA
jgi:hypothetical protein